MTGNVTEEGKGGESGDDREAFPHVNDGESVVKLHKMLYWWRLGTALAKMMGIVAAIGVGIGGV